MYFFQTGFEEEVYQNLTKARDRLKTFDVYKKNEIPQRWYYKGTNRVTDLLLVAKLPYAFNDETEKGTNIEPSSAIHNLGCIQKSLA